MSSIKTHEYELPEELASFEVTDKEEKNKRSTKMKRVITYGTFDLLHYGHINLLKRAKQSLLSFVF